MQKNIRIEGMSCGHCKSSVEKALRAVSGVREVRVDLDAKTALVDGGEGMSEESLKTAVTAQGFEVTGIY